MYAHIYFRKLIGCLTIYTNLSFDSSPNGDIIIIHPCIIHHLSSFFDFHAFVVHINVLLVLERIAVYNYIILSAI